GEGREGVVEGKQHPFKKLVDGIVDSDQKNSTIRVQVVTEVLSDLHRRAEVLSDFHRRRD
ncbi:MAG: hypothetical protein WKF67_08070, partial [Rubrobacteraceae bacterium]